MDQNLNERIKSVFDEARKLPADRRDAWVEAAVGDDADAGIVAARVGELLRDLEAPNDLFDKLTGGARSHAASLLAAAERDAEGPGSTIGPYELISTLGEGGFGTVFLAEQREPIARSVALKVIKLGMDTAQVIARFAAERQALEVMDHPNIARVLDAGVTAGGRPYFVMELCHGVPITEHCDRNRLTIRERLALVAQVCHAVQHAHQKGIIHRDIKPSNVLVGTPKEVAGVGSGSPIVKVIDFGIAKATDAAAAGRTMFTQHRQLIGTPAYMSPEQAAGSVDIDTRTDVYSLGVLLYELLVGETPFGDEALRAAAYDEIQRVVVEVDPPQPSTRLSRSTATIAAVAARRRIEPGRLGTLIRGELDWIVMRAMEKERGRRYGSADELAADIARHLAGEAIVAAPPSRSYRMRKFASRHRTQVVAAGAVAAALALGIVGTSIGLTWALREKAGADEAASRERIAAEMERARAAELELVAAFQSDMLAQVDPTGAGLRLTADVHDRLHAALERMGVPAPERDDRVREFRDEWHRINATDVAVAMIDETILKPAIEAIDARFVDQPAVDARLRQSIAERYRDLGLYDAAMALQTVALDIRTRTLGPDHPDTLFSTDRMGQLLFVRGHGAESERYLVDALDRRRRALGNDHPDTINSILTMGSLAIDRGRLDEARALYAEALDQSRRLLGPDDPVTLSAVANLGVVLAQQGKAGDAEPYLRAALEGRRRALGEQHRDTLKSTTWMGYLLRDQGRFDDAEPYYRDALEMSRRSLGEEHPRTVEAIHALAALRSSQGRFDDAELLVAEAIDILRRVLGDDHRSTLSAMHNRAYLLRVRGKLDEAEAAYRETLERRRRVLGEEHLETLTTTMNLAAVLQRQGRLDEAEATQCEVLETTRRVLGADHPRTIASTANLGSVLRDQGRLLEAEALDRDAAERSVRVLGEAHPDARSSVSRLGGTLNLLGAERRLEGRLAEAEAYFLETYDIWLRLHGASDARTIDSMNGVIATYVDWHEAEPDAGHGVKVNEWRDRRDAAMADPASE